KTASGDLVDESALDRSLNCVNWLETFAVGNTMKPLILSASSQATTPAGKSSCSEQTRGVK
ncbi:unnamed protein product, partial [Candidula unifasciata]